MQYSLIAKSLLATAVEHLDKKEAAERLKSTESSAQLFGLLPRSDTTTHPGSTGATPPLPQQTRGGLAAATPLPFETGPGRAARANNWLGLASSSPGSLGFDVDSAFTGLLSDSSLDRMPGFSVTGLSLDSEDPDAAFGTLNLFPLLETEGHIDLAHYF